MVCDGRWREDMSMVMRNSRLSVCVVDVDVHAHVHVDPCEDMDRGCRHVCHVA